MAAAGKLNQRIILQQKQTAPNSIGEDQVVWVDVVTDTPDHGVWAEARPLRGREFFAANQAQHAVDVSFFIRERAGLREDMRLIWKGEPYDISAIIPGTGPYRGLLEITAVNGVRNGR